MKFAIITQVPHIAENGQYLSYAPYVREMNIWLKYTDEVIVVAPLSANQKSPLDMVYEHANIDFRRIADFNIQSVGSVVRALFKIPRISFRIFRAMQDADHIHLRCPGNVGLLGCLIQILFPGKPKTVKYAGNWDPNARQPWSYKFQRRILSNTVLTKNMQVLVYGQWPGSTKNIKPFFTATYTEADKVETVPRILSSEIRFLFVGTLSRGKRPLYAIQLIEKLSSLGHPVRLDLYGEGIERNKLESYINDKGLGQIVKLYGNRHESEIRKAYQTSHFLVLPSQSEGWPKVVAESMFWGCLPIASAVSCVPFMLDHGSRGLLLTMDAEVDLDAIAALIDNPQTYYHKISKSMEWSREYTLDLFENQIIALLNA